MTSNAAQQLIENILHDHLHGVPLDCEAVFSSSQNGLALVELGSGRVLKANPALGRLLDRPAQQLSGLELPDLADQADRAALEQTLQALRDGAPTCMLRLRLQSEADEAVVVDLNGIVYTLAPGVRVLVCSIHDIRELVRAQRALEDKHDRLLRFVEYAPAALAMFDRDMRHLAFSRRWQTDFRFGDTDLRLHKLYDVLPELGEQRQALHRRGLLGETLSTPLDRLERRDGDVQWLRWEIVPWYTEHDEVGGLLIYAEDLTRQLQLENMVEQTLKVISAVLDQRDPYTAGHQQRVATLARDIAAAMGWPAQRCKQMELIGLVHDIGKVAVPVELLAKPSRLNDLEMQLIRRHPEVGYDIMKNVAANFPLAETIRQHHERLDGSGYPAGLKGEQILPEARVLAVADVIESMAGHRPYRQALGLDAALQEIEQQRGVLYDPPVVDAALQLFRELGHKLPE